MNKNSTPASICGFEPEMILESVAHLLHQLVNKESRIVNLYSQAVRPEGNTHAKALMDSTYQIADSWWRGIGSISDSGLILNEHFKQFDARARFNLNTLEQSLDSCPTCKQELQYSACAEILKGSILPTDCPAFATNCTPASPLGPMMVSSEGSCAAFYKYSVRSSKLS
jgi:hydrogenase expression/formation protein HypD